MKKSVCLLLTSALLSGALVSAAEAQGLGFFSKEIAKWVYRSTKSRSDALSEKTQGEKTQGENPSASTAAGPGAAAPTGRAQGRR